MIFLHKILEIDVNLIYSKATDDLSCYTTIKLTAVLYRRMCMVK